MLSNNWLARSIKQLGSAGIGTARLDALVLLEDVTGHDRTHLLAHPDLQLSANQAAKLKNVLNRRAGHEPLAYIRGKSEFYGREFMVTPAVLEPRPESETMIDLLKSLPLDRHPEKRQRNSGSRCSIADVGAGSGALGITAALELPKASVDLLEIDSEALKVAKINVDKFTLNINVLKTNLLAGSMKDYDVLLCNLPYVPDSHTINQAAMREPEIAIFGGPDGLDLYRKLFAQVAQLEKQPLYILTESLPPQHAALARIAQQSAYSLLQTEDFIQVFKS